MFYLLLLLSMYESIVVKSTNGRVREDWSYDSYMFATSWAGSKCKFHRCSHYGLENVFNVHGLWPGSGSKSPFNCQEMIFGETNYDDYVRENIYKYWNSLYNNNWGFINHEL